MLTLSFLKLIHHGKIMFQPIMHPIPYCDPLEIFQQLYHLPFPIFLDSASRVDGVGRYSFIGVDPIEKTFVDRNSFEPFKLLRQKLAAFTFEKCDAEFPFQGGVMGLFSYDLVHHLEKINEPINKDTMVPDMALGFYDVIAAFDHKEKRAAIFSCGYPENDPQQRENKARKRLDLLLTQLAQPVVEIPHSNITISPEYIQANFTADSYQLAVQSMIEFIRNGDIFEANMTQRFSCDKPQDLSAFEIYTRLRKINPAPFAAYFDMGGTIICSASPERFIQCRDRCLETRPIKGTARRDPDPDLDQQLADALAMSEKDRAENIMIVDLMRNDFSRICSDETIHVTQLCAVETFATVHHLVSVVQGKLREDADTLSIIEACFPGGSITGAPKIEAMNCIYQLEPSPRGAYCGSLGYIGFDGNMDTSILIRTFVIEDNKLFFQAGGAIVIDSNPHDEYQESLIKAAALRRVLVEGK